MDAIGAARFCLESANPLFTVDAIFDLPKGIGIEGTFLPDNGDVMSQLSLTFQRYFHIIRYDFDLLDDEGWMHYSARLVLK